ncbi:hypothetical protein B0H17DRAFT_1199841 [Mycena rosella]|uniref:Uncharacterized protein n=1 Tax=Mycena rosella TaxID=1033263 RepID=A0AAD7GJ69_MYCRO|nr:hypothetical protein B0H17DRAFT_1199841 [Mycena rosella]
MSLKLLPPDPPKEWRAILYKAPFIIDPKVNGGFVGEVKMYGSHPFPTYSFGASLEINRELTGIPSACRKMPSLDTKTQEVGINGTQETDVANTLVSYALAGILKVHEMAFE